MERLRRARSDRCCVGDGLAGPTGRLALVRIERSTYRAGTFVQLEIANLSDFSCLERVEATRRTV